MTINELRYVTAVAQEKSFSKAAERLFVAQPSLSQAIAKVEQRYKCAFFTRTPKGLEVTKAGEIYLKTAHEILELHRQMEFDLCEQNGQAENKLIIGTVTNHGSYFVPQTLSRMKQKHPHTAISITEESVPVLKESLLNGSIDVAVMRLPITEPGIAYTVLGSERVILMMHRNNPLAEKGYMQEGFSLPFIDLRLLADEFFLVFPQKESISYVTSLIFDRAGFFPKRTMEVRSIVLHEELCASNFYVSVTSQPIFKLIGGNPDVAYFNIEDRFHIPFTLAVATAKKKLPRYIEDYVDLIKQHNEFSLRSGDASP